MGGSRGSIIRSQTVRVVAVLTLLRQQYTSGIMKLLVLVLCCIGSTLCDSQAEASEQSSSSSNKITSSKSSLNSIPSAPAQKTTLLHQPHSLQQQPQQQYVPQYILQKQIPQQQQPAAMFIIAQPGQQATHQNPLFQQAVQQLLSYYNNNPQAKYQLLQQQQGGQVPQGQQVYHQQQPQAQPQPQPQMPSGALHVIPSPQLENQNVQHLPATSSGVQQQFGQQAQAPQAQQSPQATYIIPAQSQQILSGIAPGLLAQLTGQAPQPQAQHIPAPVQYAPQPQQFVAQPYPAQLNSGHFLAQQIPQFAQQFPAGNYALASQFANGLPPNFQLGGQAPQVQFGAQTEKSHQASSSSSYNPVFRTAYVKG